MKKILIPTDFSENAWNATCYALELFNNEECVFYLLNTYTPAIANTRFMAAAFEGGLVENGARLSSKKGLKNLVKQIKKERDNSNHSFKTISSFSFLVDEVKETILEKRIDLVVTGTKGASGLEAVFMGSNTVRIIKSIKNCPVLTIPYQYRFTKPLEITFVTDYKRSFDAGVMKPLVDMALFYNAHLCIMHINEEMTLNKYQKSNMYILSEYLGPVAHSFHWMPNFADKTEVIRLFLNGLNSDMLAMVNYSHSLFEELVREPVVKRVAFNTRVPLLVLPELGICGFPNNQKKVDKALIG